MNKKFEETIVVDKAFAQRVETNPEPLGKEHLQSFEAKYPDGYVARLEIVERDRFPRVSIGLHANVNGVDTVVTGESTPNLKGTHQFRFLGNRYVLKIKAA